MENFKTEELEKYYDTILKRFPEMKMDDCIELKNKLKNIKLPDMPSGNYETFYQNLNFDYGGMIEVTWNIEKLLQYKPNENDFANATVAELKTLIDFNAPQTCEVINEIKLGLKSQHRRDYIVLAMLPGFPEFRIIDGNHRVLEKKSDPKYTFKCFLLADERVLDFLEPNSRQFIETIYWLNKVIKGY